MCLLLLALSALHPLAFYALERTYTIRGPATYVVGNVNDNAVQRAEKLAQMLIIRQAHENLSRGRYSALAVVDDDDPLNSYPLFQYYGAGLYFVAGLIDLACDDVIVTYTLCLWLFSLLYVAGVYLLALRIGGSRATTALLATVCVTAPYMATNALSRYALPEFAGVGMAPMLLFLCMELLARGSRRLDATYWAMSAALAALGLLFALTHNITLLYTSLVLGIPLIVYIAKQVRPALRAILLLLAPTSLALAGVLFYLAPGVLTQRDLLISDAFIWIIKFSTEKLVDLRSLFSPVPHMSPISSTSALYLQIGWPVLLVALLMFDRRRWYVYAILAVLVVMMAAFAPWRLTPQPLQAIQWTYRLLAYVPLLVVFTARPLPLKLIAPAALLTVAMCVPFFLRDTSARATYVYHLDAFPAESAWSYYHRSSADADNALARAKAPPQDAVAIDVTRDESVPNGYRWTLDNPVSEPRTAVSYLVRMDAADLDKPYVVTTSTTFRDGDAPVDHTMTYVIRRKPELLLSYSLRNVASHEVLLTTPPTFQGSLRVERLVDSSSTFVPAADHLVPVQREYDRTPDGTTYTFRPHAPPTVPVVLPIYFSPFHRITDGAGRVLKAEPFLDAQRRSYTVLENFPAGATIRLTLSGNHPWRMISFPAIALILTLLVIAWTVRLWQFLRPTRDARP